VPADEEELTGVKTMSGETMRRSFLSVVLFNQYNLALLAAAGVFALALGSRWPLLLAAAGELIWLAFAATTRRARRWAVRYEMEQDHARRVAATGSLVRALEPGYASNVQKIEELGDDIRRLVSERGLEAALVQSGENRLERLLRDFIRMASQHQQLSAVSKHVDSKQLEEEVLGLGQSLASEHNPSARVVLEQALAIAQRRFEQQEQLEEQIRLIGYKMGTLEMSLDYLRAHISPGRSERDLSAEVAQIMQSLGSLSELDVSASALPQTPPPVMATVVRARHSGRS
jgi:hypothetical protein